MQNRLLSGAALAVVLVLGAATATEGLRSGPQPGAELPGSFNILNVNGPQAGKSNCQV